jgi:copper(I)-binding protein
MQSGTFPQLQNEFNANLEILNVTKDPAKRPELSEH